MPSQNANAAVAPVDTNIPAASVQIAPPSFARLIEAVQPAVVSIASSHMMNEQMTGQAPDLEFPEGSPFKKFFEDQFKGRKPQGRQGGDMQAMGSGFLVDPDGYIVTNNPVIAGAGEITVILHDGSRPRAGVRGRDPQPDLALLNIDSEEELPYVRFGDSEKASVGDWVVAVGNPFGLGGSVSAGIISARGRDIQSGPYDDYLQIDAPINRGNSGGPLFDASGQVVGINTAIFSKSGGSQGIGFAIPAALAKDVMQQIIENGRVVRGWLGVEAQNLSPELAESFKLEVGSGVLIAGVLRLGPAEVAGLRPGDILTHIDDVHVDSSFTLLNTIAGHKPGQALQLHVIRAGKKIELKAAVAERQKSGV